MRCVSILKSIQKPQKLFVHFSYTNNPAIVS